MHALFLVCLAGGLGATALLALFGGLAGHADHGLSHLHVDHAATHPALHGHTALPDSSGSNGTAPANAHSAITTVGTAGMSLPAVVAWTLSWISPLTIAGATLWFGAGGLIADLAFPAASTPVAVVAAIVGASIVRALMNAFARSSTAPLSAGAEGAVGVLNAAIRPDGIGEVIYVLEGLYRSAPARSVDGATMSRGTNVVIVRREHGIAYVSALDPLSALPDDLHGVSRVKEAAQNRSDP